MRSRRIAVTTAAGLALAVGAGAAIAATAGDDGKKAEDAVLKDAAKDLNVSPERLRQELSEARAAQLDRDLDRAVKADDLTQKQADEIKKRHREAGRVLGLGPGPGRRPGHHHFRGGPGLPGRPSPAGGPLRDVARALGISQAKLFSQLRAGKTLAQIAKAEGKSLAQVKQAVRASARKRLDEAVKDGNLTPRQARRMLDHLDEHLDALGSGRRLGPPHGPGGPPGPPGFERGPGGMPR